jgi:hypothetical protein
MTDPRVPRQLLGHEFSGATAAADPLGWCVIATTALLTWLFGPIVLAILAAIGFVKYWRAWRSGRQDSQCILGDMRIVLTYLAVLTVIGVVATLWWLS